jgi:hypothetical protein
MPEAFFDLVSRHLSPEQPVGPTPGGLESNEGRSVDSRRIISVPEIAQVPLQRIQGDTGTTEC